jgi:hypothetical protein
MTKSEELMALNLVGSLAGGPIYNSTVAILTGKNLEAGDDETAQVSTGTCVTMDGRFFICTVGHEIEKVGLKQIRIICTDEFSALTITLRMGGALNNGELDLGYLEVDAGLAARMPKTFIPLESILLVPRDLEKEIVVIAGFPNEDVEAKHPRYSFGMMTFATYGKAESKWGMEVTKGVRFELNYPKYLREAGKKEPSAMTKPFGMSGGGIWATGIKNSAVWDPSKTKLAGIQQIWDPPAGVVRANWMSEWVKFVRTQAGA